MLQGYTGLVPLRRVRGPLVALLGLSLVLSVSQGSLAPPARATVVPILFGAYPSPHGTESPQTATLNLEASLGRTLGAVRVYDRWDSVFPDSYTTWLRDTGHTVFLSVKSKLGNGSLLTWRAVADALPGSATYNQIVGWANAVKAFGGPLYFTYNHEPEAGASAGLGTSADYIDAWRAVVTVFRAQGVTNAQFLWITTDYAYSVQDKRSAPLWYPGDAYVDAIGADAYNWYNCRPGINNAWASLQAIIEPMRQFGLLHPTKPLMLPEWASEDDPATPGRKASWIADAQALFAQPGWQQFTAILWFDHQDVNNPGCTWFANSSPASLAALAAMGADPLYGGSNGPPPPPPPVLSDGFESGTLAQWTGSKGATVQTALVGSGTYATRETSTGTVGAYLTKTMAAAYTDVSVQTSLDLVSKGANFVNLIKTFTATGGPMATVALNTTGTLLVRNDQTGVTTVSATALPPGAWHQLRLRLLVSGTTSTVAVSLDGSSLTALSFTTSLGTAGVGRFQVGDTSTGRPFDLVVDDVEVDSPGLR